MKKTLLFLLLIFAFRPVYSQFEICDQTFDPPSSCDYFYFDTTHAHNSWQIGPPQKPVFSFAVSPPNVMITDTVNPYPVNDTSVFYVRHIANLGYNIGHTVILAGDYFTDSDSLNDYGKIEVSPDNGTTWIDIVNPGAYASYIWWTTPPPTFTGNSGTWTPFEVHMEQLGPLFNLQTGDTVLYRFTFTSDSIPESRDGLMFDNFHFEDWAEGIAEFSSMFHASVIPNPASDHISFGFDNPTNAEFRLTIYNTLGEELMNEKMITASSYEIDIHSWSGGLYYYRLSNAAGNLQANGKFVVRNQ
jgi:hypothetical protein